MTPLTRPTSVLLAAVALVLGVPAAAAASPQSGLRKSLARVMRKAGPEAGAFVKDATTGERLFAWSHTHARILASNTKLFTTGAALDHWGPDGTIVTRVVSRAHIGSSGKLKGNLYLVGGGDVTFGSRAYVRENYGGGGATVEDLAKKLYDRGLRRITGRVLGDESLFDSRRSGPAEGYAASAEVGGPLTALVYNHGLMSNGYFQRNPPVFAAAALARALHHLHVKIGGGSQSRHAPDGSKDLAHVRSLPMARIVQLTALPSDNFFAELLAKGLGDGTTAGGAAAIERFAKRRGATVRLSDGSGLSRANQTSPQEVVKFVDRELRSSDRSPFEHELPVAGVSGTLADRMQSGPAHRHCHAKTGTLYGVSALSGYCNSHGGDRLLFSILLNGQGSDDYAHSLEDRMAQSMANYKG